MNQSHQYNADAIVVANRWPCDTIGYEFALRTTLNVCQSVFQNITMFGVLDQPVPAGIAEDFPSVRWVHIPAVTAPKWVRFMRNLASPLPAITSRTGVSDKLLKAVGEAVEESRRHGRPNCVVFEATTLASFLPGIERRYPGIASAIRSHEVLSNSFAGLDQQGSLISRLAWRLEWSKINRFEHDISRRVSRLWSISEQDSSLYHKIHGIEPHGVVGLAMNVDRYASVDAGDVQTVVYTGSADLRKAKGLLEFVTLAWPMVRAEFPDARLVLGGRFTDRFTDASLGITGHGFVDDDRDVLSQGRIFINPQKIGGGIKLKSIVAMLAGKTLVSTSNGVEGVAGKAGEDFVVTDDPRAMASEIIRLMKHPDAVGLISETGRRTAQASYSDNNLIKTAGAVVGEFAELVTGETATGFHPTSSS